MISHWKLNELYILRPISIEAQAHAFHSILAQHASDKFNFVEWWCAIMLIRWRFFPLRTLIEIIFIEKSLDFITEYSLDFYSPRSRLWKKKNGMQKHSHIPPWLIAHIHTQNFCSNLHSYCDAISEDKNSKINLRLNYSALFHRHFQFDSRNLLI